ncbi:MAG: hypothetical protein HUJ69_00910, partial [Lachnospiraceae bacterium]|nr:hypothetical protein [Lachnospiraceae bacterium]
LSHLSVGSAYLLFEAVVPRLGFCELLLKVGEFAFPAEKIPEIEIHGRHELVFSCDNRYYELHVEAPASACCFLWFIHAANAKS